MTIFWIFTAGLAGLAILFVITPLLSRRESGSDVSQDQLNLEVFRQQLQELKADQVAGKLDRVQYKDSCRDLERELLYDVDGASATGDQPRTTGSVVTALILALAVPAFAFGLYRTIGNPNIIPRLEMAATGQTVPPAKHPGAADGQRTPSLDVLVQRLAAKMEENPENLEGWLMLGRTYFAVKQPGKALEALEKANELAPENPDVMLAYAEAIAANGDGKLAGRPAELIAKALEIDPDNVTGRWLIGLVSYQSGDFPGSVEHWESILSNLDPSAQDTSELREFIADARKRAGMPPAMPAAASEKQPAVPVSSPGSTETETASTTPPSATESGAADVGLKVMVNVSLAEPLWKQADVNHTLFVYAKAVSGPPMPLAVKRLRTGDLPVTVTLDDSMAMMPAMRLSAFPEVTIGARISASGQATPSSGDLEGEVGPVRPGQSGPVDVVIDRVRP